MDVVDRIEYPKANSKIFGQDDYRRAFLTPLVTAIISYGSSGCKIVGFSSIPETSTR